MIRTAWVMLTALVIFACAVVAFETSNKLWCFSVTKIFRVGNYWVAIRLDREGWGP